MDLPHDDDLRFLVSSYAHLLAEHGEGIGTPDLVEPTSEYFPDEFSATPEGVARFVRRVLSFAPVADDLPIELMFLEADASGGGSCGTGGCGTGGGGGKARMLGGASDTEDGYRVSIAVSDVGNPALLATSVARSAGHIVLGLTGDDITDGPLAEIAASACGFGLLLFNGSCVYTKSCGGLRAHQGTHLDVASSAVLLSLFLRVTGAKPGTARAHLEATQSEAFDEALRWVDSNDALVDALRDHPASLADGVFAISPIKGAIARFFSGKRARPDEITVPAKPRKERSAAEVQRIAETKALVEEALRAR